MPSRRRFVVRRRQRRVCAEHVPEDFVGPERHLAVRVGAGGQAGFVTVEEIVDRDLDGISRQLVTSVPTRPCYEFAVPVRSRPRPVIRYFWFFAVGDSGRGISTTPAEIAG